jgi:hypothetical protein
LTSSTRLTNLAVIGQQGVHAGHARCHRHPDSRGVHWLPSGACGFLILAGAAHTHTNASLENSHSPTRRRFATNRPKETRKFLVQRASPHAKDARLRRTPRGSYAASTGAAWGTGQTYSFGEDETLNRNRIRNRCATNDHVSHLSKIRRGGFPARLDNGIMCLFD